MEELSSEIAGWKIGGAGQPQIPAVSFPIFKNEDEYRGATKETTNVSILVKSLFGYQN